MHEQDARVAMLPAGCQGAGGLRGCLTLTLPLPHAVQAGVRGAGPAVRHGSPD